MHFRYFACLMVLFIVMSSGCEQRCEEKCADNYVTIIAVGYPKAELDDASVTAYQKNSNFSVQNTTTTGHMYAYWQYPSANVTTSDTLICTNLEYTNDYEIIFADSTGTHLFKISDMTFTGQFSVNDYCPEGGTATGPQCTNPAHLTAYTLNGTQITGNNIYLVK